MHSDWIQDDSLEFVLRLAMMNIRSCPQNTFCRLLLMIIIILRGCLRKFPSQISTIGDNNYRPWGLP